MKKFQDVCAEVKILPSANDVHNDPLKREALLQQQVSQHQMGGLQRGFHAIRGKKRFLQWLVEEQERMVKEEERMVKEQERVVKEERKTPKDETALGALRSTVRSSLQYGRRLSQKVRVDGWHVSRVMVLKECNGGMVAHEALAEIDASPDFGRSGAAGE